MKTDFREQYLAPSACVLLVELSSVIAESPLPGGNEGIGFENWN